MQLIFIYSYLLLLIYIYIQFKFITQQYITSYTPQSNNNIMSDLTQFKQQTFALLREQAIQIKQNTHNLSLKSQQITFLKQTIQALQTQNTTLMNKNSEYKNKLQVVMQEIKKYDEQVVQKIYKQNRQLHQKWYNIEMELTNKNQIIKQMSQNINKCNQNNCILKDNMIKKQRELNAVNQELQAIHQKYISAMDGNQKCQKKYDVYQLKITNLETYNQQLLIKLETETKQVSYLIRKCQQTISTYEQKLKKTKQKMINKQQYNKLKQQLTKSKRDLQNLKKDTKRSKQQTLKTNIKLTTLKQQCLKQQYQLQQDRSLIQTDLKILQQSLSIRKRISQFQSIYSANFHHIYQLSASLFTNHQQLKIKLTMRQQQLQTINKSITKMKTIILDKQQYQTNLHDKYNRQVQSIQASYQGKIMQLSIKIKQQQKAIYQLSIKQQQRKDICEQYTQLNNQYNAYRQQTNKMKQTLQNTIGQYRKQNQKLLGEIKQLVELCNENINTQNTMNNLKHYLVGLLCVVHYLELVILRNKQMRRKLYLPFINYYYQVTKNINEYNVQNNNKSNNNILKNNNKSRLLLKKFKSHVWAIIAIKRMQKYLQINNGKTGGAGILRYTQKAIKLKTKIQQYPKFCDKILTTAISQQDNIVELITMSRLTFKWSHMHNYRKIAINLPSIQQLLLLNNNNNSK